MAVEQWGEEAKIRIIYLYAIGAEPTKTGLEMNGIPNHNGRQQEIESRRSVQLIFIGPIPHFSLSAKEEFAGERIESRAFFEAQEYSSPHYYYPHDQQWIAPVTPVEDLAHIIGLAQRKDPLSLEGFEGSGADFPARYKPYLQDGATIVTSPHKV